MELIEITFSKKELFKVASIYSYNQILNDVIHFKNSSPTEITINEEHFEWFLKTINKADGIIQRKISHILDHDTMLKELKIKISKKETTDEEIEDEIKYIVKLSHVLQIYTLTDAIEDALIAEVFKNWCVERGLLISNEHGRVMDNLRSISLMIDTNCRRPYILN